MPDTPPLFLSQAPRADAHGRAALLLRAVRAHLRPAGHGQVAREELQEAGDLGNLGRK